MDMEIEKTRRQHMVDLLQWKRWSVKDLAKELEVKVSIVLDDLEHIRRSVSSRHKMRIFPSECNHCGFKFKERSRFTTPSRCPRCKGKWISPTMMKIELT
jgi:predicted Zn-ribbon and HTH transcriptional regulator